MKIKSYEFLSSDLVDKFLGRKNALHLGVVVDTRTDAIIPVPQGIEHMDFVPTLFGLSRADLIEDPSVAEHIIPSLIEFDYEKDESGLLLVVKGVVTGVSGLEIGLRLRHEVKDMVKAHALVLHFVEQGDYPKSKTFVEKLNTKYAKK